MLTPEYYFSEKIFKSEIENIFSKSQRYVGNALMVPKSGDYSPISWMNNSHIIKNINGEYFLMSNICRHRQAIIHSANGNGNNHTCNLHGWTYDNKGVLVAAPHFDNTPCKSLSLEKLKSWNGMLFQSGVDIESDLNELNISVDLSNYVFQSSKTTDYNFNWKTFIEVYSEDYHVDVFHPGLSNFVDCSKLEWKFGKNCHVQYVGVKNELNTSGTPVYEKYQNDAKTDLVLPEHGAIWLTYYPNLMVEIYPKCVVISLVVPETATTCKVITEFYYPDHVIAFEPDFIKSQQDAYFETAVEDDEICNRMNEGRKMLHANGDDDFGPYQLPMELGMKHFHEYYLRTMK